MLRNAVVVLAVVVVLGSSGLSTSAFARGGGYGAGGDGFRANQLGGGYGYTPGDGNRTRGLRSGFHRYEGRDVWGHWGAYYGPMIP
jgi:hypothetical protein